MPVIAAHRSTTSRRSRRAAALVAVLSVVLAGLTVSPSTATADPTPETSASSLRIGVLALANAIAAVGQTPELAEPLPFTRTSPAYLLDLDNVLSTQLTTALANSDTQAALLAVPGITDPRVSDGGKRITFGYDRTRTVPLELAQDDGDLRFLDKHDAGDVTVHLATRPGAGFEVRVDSTQKDPLLQFALVSQPVMDYSVSVDAASVGAFRARQGFTNLDVTGGHYRISRTATITMRDPDGRSLLTLEDLRYSTLPDLFRIERDDTSRVDIGFDLRLPGSVGVSGGAAGSDAGTLTMTQGAPADGVVWPTLTNSNQQYGAALDALTGLSMADGLTSLSKYTGASLALQQAANVQFPNLTGGTGDLFAPGSDLLDLLATSAVAQIRCGLAPGNPPSGVAAPGDTVYCDAVPASGLGEVSSVSWSTDDGTISAHGTDGDTVGSEPSSAVRIDGSNGQPDVTVVLTMKDEDGSKLTARTMPHTVQDVVSRIRSLDTSADSSDAAVATVNLAARRLDVAVDLQQPTRSAPLALGNPASLGALVGLTGLEAGGNAAKATATATGSSYDLGFGISTETPATGEARSTVLLPRDASLIRVTDVGATAPVGAAIPARIGFLGVTAKVTKVGLSAAPGIPAADLELVDPTTKVLQLNDLLDDTGKLSANKIVLKPGVIGDVAFDATENAISPDVYATGGTAPATGSASVDWPLSGVPKVTFTADYRDKLRVFDPVPAAFLHGTTSVQPGTKGDGGVMATPDVVTVTVPDTDLRTALGLPTAGGSVEVARRLISNGVACQNFTVTGTHTLTCDGLAPQGVSAFTAGDGVDLIVAGDPFALRDGVIEGLSASLNTFDRLDADHVADSLPNDQYTSTLPLVDLTPSQLATERTDLATGLAKLSAAADEDETGKKGGMPAVSSAQEMSAAVGTLVPHGQGLTYDLGAQQLGVALAASTPAGYVRDARLRFAVGGPGQVVGDDTVRVSVDSSTTLATDVDRSTARSFIGDASRTSSTVGLQLDDATLSGRDFQAGIGSFRTTTAGNRAALAMSVTTDYDPASGQLRTTRSGGDHAASADLTMALDNRTIHYVADATGTSGGSGTDQPAPEAMQVKFLAEGLDGYASALDAALDGSSARNVHQNGLPVAAPLIGSHLDAGAKVGDRLTDVTTQLRDTLQEIPADTEAGALGKALTDAAKEALPAGGDLAVTAVSAHVTCSSSGDACDADATSTEWFEVTLKLTLTSATTPGQAPFDIGEAGVNIKSDRTVVTSSSWSVPVTLKLTRGVGPQISVAPADALALDATAKIGTEQTPCAAAGSQCVKAVMGYLPAELTPTGTGAAAAANAAVSVGVRVATTGVTAPTDYSLFDLYDGKLAATASFADDDGAEQGVDLAFRTIGKSGGAFDMSGAVNVPWTAAHGFGNVTYDQVALDTPQVVKSLAAPFRTVDPYLGPARDVMDVLRAKIPVVSDLSELGGGGEISLLSLLDTLGGKSKKLELAVRIIHFVDAVAQIIKLGASLEDTVSTTQLAEAGTLLTLAPRDVAVADSCTEVTRETVETVSPTGSKVKKQQKTTAACEKEDDDEQAGESDAAQARKKGAKDQTTQEKRTGTRAVSTSVATTTSKFTAPMPGFSLPFMQDPNQLVDVLTGEGEASYFRIDFGHLVAEVQYTQEFGPIMAGPIPIKPFVGGSISVEGRLAVGFDSLPQTQAAQGLPHAGAVDALITAYKGFDKSSVIREGFYLDDFEDGVDVPEVKMVTTIEAGASVSIGIVSAGIKGQVQLTLNLDLHDPNHDGKVRMAELRAGGAKCAFDASAYIEAFIKVFVEINLLITKKSWDYDILRFGPYELFKYECPDTVPSLVRWNGAALQLTSGPDNVNRNTSDGDVSDQYDVRQFDVDGGADGTGGGSPMTTYEVAAFGQVQRIDVTKDDKGVYHGVIWQVSKAVATAEQGRFDTSKLPTFTADGGAQDDTLRFLTGETYVGVHLVTTPFAAHVNVSGGDGNDTIVTGTADDDVRGGSGNDVVDTGLGNDSVHGDGGNDLVTGGAGRDDLSGDSGSDRLSGGPGADRVVGGADDDSLAGGPGRDVRAVLVGPQGSDAQALATRQAEVGFDSGDVLVGGDGADIVDGNDGSDVVVGGSAATLSDPVSPATLFEQGGRSVNVLVKDSNGQAHQTVQTVQVDTAVVPGAQALDGLCASGPQQSGTPGTDFVTGGAEADVVVGSDGTDELDGGAGPDEVCGRNGDDHLSGDGAAKPSKTPGENDDVMRGGAGDDRMDAGAGDDAVYGDDVTLYRGGRRVLDGTLGTDSSGSGEDYLDGADGDDVLSGGDGSDLVRGGAGDDVTSGEGRDTAASGGPAPDLADRLVACNATTRIVNGYVDLNGDLLAGPTTIPGVQADDGRFAGLEVSTGRILVIGGTDRMTGLLGGDTVVIDGLVDLDRDGTVGPKDNGTVQLASMLATTSANSDGDCILGEDGDDQLRGGNGSDYLGSGPGTDLADGGDGNDLVLGDGGTDVLLGGPHQDVVVGGDGADHLVGGAGDDRLRGSEGDDSLVGGSETSQAVDGEDVELGGRGTDVLVAENGTVVSKSVSDQVMQAGWHSQPDVPATVVTGQGAEHFAASAVLCGPETTATRWVTLLAGGPETRVAHASPGGLPGGPVLYDELYGGYDCDWVFGSRGDDLVRGGQQDDVVEGGSGNDTAYGDAGDDVVIGGSTVDPTRDQQVTVGRSGAGVSDGADTIFGDGGPDLEVGSDLVAADNATPKRVSGSTYTVRLHDLETSGATVPATTHGDDVVYGDAPGVLKPAAAGDRVFGQGGDDMLNGGESDDYLEGNSGTDTINGGGGQDDLLGGSSSKDGLPLGLDRADRLTQAVPAVDTTAAGLRDERDVVHGGAGHDVVLGDNGRITRPAGGKIDGTHAYRSVAMADTGAGDTSGSDDLSGDQGDDVLYGQLDDTARSPSGTVLGTGDRLHGGTDADTLVGDLGVVQPTPATGGRRLVSNGSFVQEDVYQAGTLVPVTTVPDALAKVGGSDVAWGDDGNDTLRLGADRDLATGGAGDDVVLGGDGDDALWGGIGHDRLFGGYGDDELDLKRPATGASSSWSTYADVAGVEDLDDKVSTLNGADLVYGGWGADRMQADQGGAGRVTGSDQLVDWVGNHNLYLVCNGAYGAGYVQRQSSPDMEVLLSTLVTAAGGVDVGRTGSAAFVDLGLVTNSGNSENSKPIAGAPANYTCEGPG